MKPDETQRRINFKDICILQILKNSEILLKLLESRTNDDRPMMLPKTPAI